MTQTAEYISPTDTAKLIRKSLKAAFPATRFGVRTNKYSGGSSIDVEWTDGPTTKAVEAIAGQYAGATFDGMRDLKEHHTSELNGQLVRFGADFVFCRRLLSDIFVAKIIAALAAKYEAEPVSVDDYRQGRAWNLSPFRFSVGDHWSWQSMINRASEDRREVA